MVYEIELAIFGLFAGLVTPISIYLGKKLIEPIFQLRELVSRILYSLTYYASTYSNPGITPQHRECSDVLRQHASDLESKLYLIKYPRIPAVLGLIPKKVDVLAASRELIGMSNMLFSTQNVKNIYEASVKARKLLS